MDGLLASKFRNAGQTCVCANRVFVEAPVYEAFAAKLRRAVSAFVVGNGLTPGVTIGPLIDDEAVVKVEEHVTDAAARGATVYLGGQRHPLGGTFFEPTILTDVPPNAKIMHEETFGPEPRLLLLRTFQAAEVCGNRIPGDSALHRCDEGRGPAVHCRLHRRD